MTDFTAHKIADAIIAEKDGALSDGGYGALVAVISDSLSQEKPATGGDYTAWRISFQSSEQAARAAYREWQAALCSPAAQGEALGWVVRERRSREGELMDCFVEAPKANGMPYALEVLGDDYTGYGDIEGKLRHCQMIVAWANAAPPAAAADVVALSDHERIINEIRREKEYCCCGDCQTLTPSTVAEREHLQSQVRDRDARLASLTAEVESGRREYLTACRVLSESQAECKLLKAEVGRLRKAADALHALLDRNISYVDKDVCLPFESHTQAFNHVLDARRAAEEAAPERDGGGV